MNLTEEEKRELKRLLFIAASFESNRMDATSVKNCLYFIEKIDQQEDGEIIKRES